MPLGILTDEEFNKELKIYDINGVNKINDKKDESLVEYKEINKSGRNEGDLNKPETLRQIIADCKINGDSDKEIKDSFKVSTSSINAYTNGQNGTNDKVNERLAKFVKNVRNSVTRRASRTLIKSLDLLTDEKISELKANEISVLAKNMSSIISDMEDKNKNINPGPLAQFIIFQPPQKSINQYDVIDVKS